MSTQDNKWKILLAAARYAQKHPEMAGQITLHSLKERDSRSGSKTAVKGKNMELADRSICTGCGACQMACRQGAIVFQTDEEGFPIPVLQAERCVECGRCALVCPALNKPEAHKIKAAYAAQSLDRDSLKESSSGGLFTLFAREILNRGGAVYGCVWDEEYNAVLKRAVSEEELLPMRGSKYVWSRMWDIYPLVREDLEAGKPVLFTGMPCQGAALRSYLRKDYPGLYVVNFLCGGAPSPLALHEYVKTISEEENIPLKQLDLKFRDKEKYGYGVHISYEGKNGRIRQKYYQNPYFFSYHTKVFHRAPCYHCQFKSEGRLDDLTFGDYWGSEMFHPEFNTRDGVSLVLVNTEKGEELLDAVKGQVQLSRTRPESISIGNNLVMGSGTRTYTPPAFRNAFFAMLKANGWKAAEKRYLYNRSRLKLYLKEKMPKGLRKSVKKLLRRRQEASPSHQPIQ